jgi:hypothetical protein
MNQWITLTRALDQTMAAHVPDWTDHNQSDAGITLLELMAFLAEQSLYQTPRGDRAATAVSRIVRALEANNEREPVSVSVDGERWERVRALDEAGPDSPVFTAENGVITFGDGVRGCVPATGSTISATYREGGGNTSIAVRTAWPLSDRRYVVATRRDGTIHMDAPNDRR